MVVKEPKILSWSGWGFIADFRMDRFDGFSCSYYGSSPLRLQLNFFFVLNEVFFFSILLIIYYFFIILRRIGKAKMYYWTNRDKNSKKTKKNQHNFFFTNQLRKISYKFEENIVFIKASFRSYLEGKSISCLITCIQWKITWASRDYSSPHLQ